MEVPAPGGGIDRFLSTEAAFAADPHIPMPMQVESQSGAHQTVNHSAEEYVKTGGFHHTNTVESHFALLKRGIFGTFHNISEAHLSRYLAEFDFRANTRDMTDGERAAALLAAARGKRLLYRQPN